MQDSKCKYTSAIAKFICWKIGIANKLAPVANFLARLLLADIFFTSGRLKLPSGFLGIGQGDWSTTLFLFEEEYKVPLISPALAAYSGTAVEILAPIFLLLGLGTRVAAAALFIMTLVIEYTYQSSMDHCYWGVICLILMTYGGNKLSLDYYLFSKCSKGKC